MHLEVSDWPSTGLMHEPSDVWVVVVKVPVQSLVVKTLSVATPSAHVCRICELPSVGLKHSLISANLVDVDVILARRR